MAWTIALSDADISTLATAYTMAAGSEGRMSASFTNRSTNATATVQLWVVPNGEVRGNEHLKEAGTTLGVAGTPQATLERFFVVPAGAVVFVQASTANVSCQVQGDVVASTTVGNGTSSISYGSGWTASAANLRAFNGAVTLSVTVNCINPSTSTLLTLPTGYRPSVAISGLVCSYSSPTITSGQNQFATVNISTAGVVTVDNPGVLSGSATYAFNIQTSFNA